MGYVLGIRKYYEYGYKKFTNWITNISKTFYNWYVLMLIMFFQDLVYHRVFLKNVDLLGTYK